MTSEQNISKTKKNNQSIPKILKYCAAALSVVSFLTTMQGVDDLIVDNDLMAGMISFAVQGIILVLGLQFIKVWRTITTSYKENGSARRALHGIIIGLYIASIAFSSFFSFVYITNSAYKDVGKTDYNVEIDQFLVDSANKLEWINDKSSDTLLQEIRTYAPEFSNLLQINKENAANEIQAIVDDVKKYEESTIKEEDRFTAAGAAEAFNAANSRDINADELARCEAFERSMNSYVNLYETYYNNYLDLYETFKSQTDTSNVKYGKGLIDDLKDSVDNDREKLFNVDIVLTESINSYVELMKGQTISYYDRLLNELNSLNRAYGRIEENATVQVGVDSKLENFYNAIYSNILDGEKISTTNETTDDENTSESDESTTDEKISKIDEASTELRKLLTTYLNSLKENEISSESESRKIEQLSKCIADLDELNKRMELQKEITAFKSDQLNKVYNIVIPSEETNAEGSTEASPTEQDVTNVSEDGLDVDTVNPEEWENERRWHINQFIGLLKRVPSSDDAAENAELSEMLDTAYELSRRNLQPISEMEIALNFLKSEHKTVAWIGVAIAIFLDIASFLIGIILFFYKPDDQEKTALESSSVDEVGQTA